MVDLLPLSSVSFETVRSLYEWTYQFARRFPHWIDLRFLKGFHILWGLAPASFFKERSLFHLKRILLAQYLLQKRIEQGFKRGEEQQIDVRIFRAASRLCV